MKHSHSVLAARLAALAMGAVMGACRQGVPAEWSDIAERAVTVPSYDGVTVPCNIAPLNFRIEGNEKSGYVIHFSTSGNPEGFTVTGPVTDIPLKEWHRLLGNARGDTLRTDIFVEDAGQWHKYPTIRTAVSDSIDPYISYRLIEPSYVSFETMAICQRNLENFDEWEIFNSQALSNDKEGQCINCHSYQAYNRDGNMQMHTRVTHAGTIIKKDGKLKKVTLKCPGTISSGVYPSWHPTLPLIAYSLNSTTQSFHTRNTNKVEVQDSKSDLVLYDVDRDEMTFISNEPTELETFPCWHPDGKSLWYVSAHIPELTEDKAAEYLNFNYDSFKYNLCRKPFDPVAMCFGETDTVVDAAKLAKSITLPRPSPDGRWLIYTQGEYGTFHIWHKDADLHIIDLVSGRTRPMSELNSDNVESYHSWSSDGNWIIFSSRRDDGSYTRLYIAHFDKKTGVAGKPFRLPQPTPDHDMERLKSYNIPEFMVCPVDISKYDLVQTAKADAVQVRLK